MQALFLPGRGRTSDPSRGDSAKTLSGGGTAVARRLNAKRSFSMTWEYLPEYAADQLRGFYLGLFDDPVGTDFVFVDSTVRNVLSLDLSATGQRSQAAVEWASASGTVARSTTLTGPAQGAGVVTWTSPGASGLLTAGPVALDVSKAPVYLPGEPCAVSLYVRASAAASLTVRLQGYDAAGAVISGAVADVAVAATTSFQRAAVAVAAGVSAFASAVFVRPVVLTGASAPGSVSISAGQLEYALTATAWQPGFGSPRVVIPSTVGRTVNVIGLSDHTLTLAER